MLNTKKGGKVQTLPLFHLITNDLFFCRSHLLVLEVTHTSANHSNATFVGLLDRIFVANTSTRLNDSCYAILRSQCYSVIEWEETVRSQD